MTISEELLIAYADGELSGEDARAVEAELKNMPELRVFVERQQKLRRHLQSSFASELDAPIPDRFLKALEQSPVSPRWRARQVWARVTHTVVDRDFLVWSALPAAGALACGILIGLSAIPTRILDVGRHDGVVTAQGALAAALDSKLASAQGANDSVRVGVSFRAKDDRYCRTFESAGTASSLSGVACRDASGWSVVALAASAASEQAGAYHMAASAMPDSIRSTVTSLMAGAPLDAAEERRARDSGWIAR